MKKIIQYYRSLDIELLMVVAASIGFTTGFFYAIIALTEPLR